jgi:competence protein ComEC
MIAPPLFGLVVGWVIGAALVWSEAVSFELEGMVAVLTLCLLLLHPPLRWRLPAWSLIAAMLWTSVWWLYDVSLMQVDKTWLQSPQQLSGTILQYKQQGAMKRMRLDHVKIHNGAQTIAVRGRIDVYDWGRHTQHWQLGDRVQLTARLRLPRNRANPAGFNYLTYCFEHHIAMTGSVRGNVTLLQAASGLEQLRQRVRDALPSSPVASGVLLAILLGERDRIPMAVQDAFAASGAAHLLAISGLHIGMVAAWAAAIIWWLLTRRESWVIQLPVRQLSLLAGVLAALAYATLAAWPLPTQRAVLMLTAAMCAWWWRWRYPPLNILCFALWLMLLWQPAAIVSLSLWLSFIATAALLLLLTQFERTTQQGRIYDYMRGLVLVSACASLATLPLIVDAFGRVPVWTLLANLLLVPLYGIWVLPLALLAALCAVLGMASIAQALLQYAGWGIEIGNTLLQTLFHTVGGNMWVANVPLWLSLSYGAVLLWAGWLLHHQRKRQAGWWLIGGLSVYLLAVIPEHPPTQRQWWIWDVGQGAASTLLQKDGTVLQIDVPGRRGSQFNGGTTVAAGLRSLGLVHIDVLCISHAQSDHGGGVLRLLASMRTVGALCLADVPSNRQWQPLQQAIRWVESHGGHVHWLSRGDRVQVGELTMDVLWPPKDYAPANTNNASLVLSLTLANGERMLFGGDMEAAVEQALLAAELPPHTWMLMPHHGSRTSSTPALLDALQAKVAVAQTGYGNHWHFPAVDVVARYQQRGIHVDNTAAGAITYQWLEQGMQRQQTTPPKRTKYNTALQWVSYKIEW